MKDDRLISLNAAIEAFAPYAEYESNRTNAEWVRRIYMVLSALPSARPMFEEVSPEEVSGAININPASLWPAHKLLTFLQKEGYVICKKTL